jgi:hypothetical protein
MYGYASCFGFDPSEFWPVQFGSLGRGTETEVQHMKATGKGGTEFALAYGEQLQRVLPDTLHFEFEQRDDAGSAQKAAVKRAKLDWVSMAYQSGLQAGQPLLSRDEARQLLADEQLIPSEWTLTPDESSSTDTEDADETEEPAAAQAERMLDTVPVRRAIAQFPYEPIVRVTWPGNKMQVLYDPLRRKRTFAKPQRRAKKDILYKKGDVVITEGDVDKAIEEARELVGDEFASLLVAPLYKGGK